MLLEDKHAVIYGGSGAIGSAVAAAFEHEGAFVYCPPHGEVDALDEAAVEAHAAGLPRIDISFNLISHAVVQGTPMAEMSVEDYVRPVEIAVRTNFITARAAARRMTGGGVILFFGGEGEPPRGYHLGALQTGFHAVEAMRRQLAVELGERGIRTVTLRTGGIPETIPDLPEVGESIAASTLLGRAAKLEDVGRVAAFVACDHARTMTAATVNISAGALID
jgi:3-oxoacyl-[acyl-carrier protein] reductase